MYWLIRKSTIIFVIFLMCACNRSDLTNEVAARLKYLLVQKSYPSHDTYELDHQLIVRSEDPQLVMKLLDIKPGMVVGDIGCGSGFYTTKIIEATGEKGVVHAIDIQQAAIDYLKDRLEQEQLDKHNIVKLALSSVESTNLPENTLERALLSHSDFYAFPELLPENIKMIDDLHKVIKPGGYLIVVQNMTVLPELVLHYQGKGHEIIKANFEKAGFKTDYFEGDPNVEVYFRFKNIK